MYYRGYSIPVSCPRCGTMNNQIRQQCRFCNGPLKNYCSDEDCNCLNMEEARYCKKCGKPTLFMKHKVFDKRLCASLRIEAKFHYDIHGDPDSPEYKARQARIRSEFRRSRDFCDSWDDGLFDDYMPEPPIDPDDIPYY